MIALSIWLTVTPCINVWPPKKKTPEVLYRRKKNKTSNKLIWKPQNSFQQPTSQYKWRRVEYQAQILLTWPNIEKLTPVESSSTKYQIFTKLTLNIKNDEHIYYQDDQVMEVVLLYHKNLNKNKGIIKIDSSSVNEKMFIIQLCIYPDISWCQIGHIRHFIPFLLHYMVYQWSNWMIFGKNNLGKFDVCLNSLGNGCLITSDTDAPSLTVISGVTIGNWVGVSMGYSSISGVNQVS